MQSQITSLQRDAGDAEQKERKLRESEEKVRQLEQDLQGFRRVSDKEPPWILFKTKIHSI
jgi:hypothetical protein